MIELDIPISDAAAQREGVRAAIIAAVEEMELMITFEASLSKYPWSTHWHIRRPVTVEAGPKRISILPSDRFLLTCDVFYEHPLIGQQSLDMEVTPERYAEEIAPARTFGFSYELDQMRNMGLIRGAALDNAICFNRRGVDNPDGLRFVDECCRHKALDLIGDLALIGKPLLGHVIAERAGHAMHTALVARIMSDPSLYEILSFDQLATRVAHALVS